MNDSRILPVATLALALLLAGCTTAKSTIRQKDGTYRTTNQLIWKSDFSDFWSFRCAEDHMVATELNGVTYAWPKGSGSLTGLDSVKFTGGSLRCEVQGRILTINGRTFAEFNEGDTVRIMPDGRVFVNDVEHFPTGTG